VDDEPLAQQVLEKHINQIANMQLVQRCSNALEAFDILSREKIDLIFLDIKMPKLNGIDFIKTLKTPPAVIFTTAFSEYAAISYDLDAVDYLLKPITYEKFSRSIAKFLKLYSPQQEVANYSYFKVNGKLVKIEHKDIITAQSVKDYIVIKTRDESYITHMTMKYLVELLPEKLFTRTHRSYLIGVEHITSIGKSTIEIGGIKVPVGENYRSGVLVNLAKAIPI
jgi:two-component system LytT family response regulator